MTLTKAKSINHGSNNNSNNTYSNNQECADCGSRNTQWASLNHGVIICDDCCLAHRNLGRCISVIKSLRKSYWPQSLIDTLYELVRKNSNQIWESNLSTVIEQNKSIIKLLKKPTPKDSHNTKLNFIRMKYENLAFISRSKYSSIEELNQQLISSVRSNDYESTLRILAQGADANYRSQEDGNQPLHIATLNNQLGQIELLCLYGADLTSMNRLGQTPIDLAEQIGLNSSFLDRLFEIQFELTDDLSYFLCNKKPDHRDKKQHFLIPISSANSANESVLKLNLDQLPDHLFEELCKDIYDEMDRRQIEAIWKSSVGPNLVNEPIPFLIIKSCFSQTRNQLRQKLARFNPTEFSSLLVEILTETQRRYDLFTKSNNTNNIEEKKEKEKTDNQEIDQAEEDEDDPLYDKVPSDEDYASVASESSLPTTSLLNRNNKNIDIKDIDDEEDDDSTPSFSNSPPPLRLTSLDKTLSPALVNTSNKLNQSICLKSSNSLVANAESTLNSIINSLNQLDPNTQNLSQTNQATTEKDVLNELKSENELMQAMIERLMEENAQLRADKMLLSTTSIGGLRSMETSCIGAPSSKKNNNSQLMDDCVNIEIMAFSSTFSKTSMNNMDNNSEELNLYSTVNSHKKLDLMREKFYLSPSHSISNNNNNNNKNVNYEYFEQQQHHQLNDSFNNHEHDELVEDTDELNDSNGRNLFENQLKIVEEENNGKKEQPNYYQDISLSLNDEKNQTKSALKSNDQNAMPSKNSVIKKMKKITKSVQDLFKATKESEFHMLKELCDKVNNSVNEMTILFPANIDSLSIKENLIQLNETCKNLVDLVNGYHTKISTTSLEAPTLTAGIKSPNKLSLFASASSSSAITNDLATSQQMQDNILLKNMIISNLVNYSYEIAHTVKRIVCIMGADN